MLEPPKRPVPHEPAHCQWTHVALDGGAGAVLFVTGVILLATSKPGTDSLGFPNDVERKLGGVGLIGIATADVVSALYGVGVANECEEHNDQVAKERTLRDAVAAQRARAWTLTQDAAAAARAGKCDLVAMFDSQVHALDAEFHATVFRRDVAIARCLVARGS